MVVIPADSPVGLPPACLDRLLRRLRGDQAVAAADQVGAAGFQ
jgi:hypothetical protein